MTIKTLPLLLLTATVLVLAACSRNDDENVAEIFRRRVTPSELPVPSCADTNDDGKFESWNSAEEYLIHVARTVIKPPQTFVTGFIRDIRLAKRRIPVDTPKVEWSAQIDTAMNFYMSLVVLDRESGSLQAIFDQRIQKSATNLARQSFVTPLTGGKLSPGCKRLYYSGYLVDQSPQLPLSNGSSPIDTLRVLYQGHFDVEIY